MTNFIIGFIIGFLAGFYAAIALHHRDIWIGFKYAKHQAIRFLEPRKKPSIWVSDELALDGWHKCPLEDGASCNCHKGSCLRSGI